MGQDYRIYHSTPATSTGRASDTISGYFSRFSTTDKHTLLRSNNATHQYNAAIYAQSIYNQVKKYDFHPELSNFSNNYCSKFVWQAFYYGNGIDLTGKGYSRISYEYIYPSEILNSTRLYKVATFTR